MILQGYLFESDEVIYHVMNEEDDEFDFNRIESLTIRMLLRTCFQKEEKKLISWPLSTLASTEQKNKLI